MIERWQRKIKESSSKLLAVEQKIGDTNKQLRALRGVGKPVIKSLSQLPREAAALQPSPEPRANNGAIIDPNPKAGRVLYLEFFHQLVSENIDPRLVEVLERDAHGLVNDYRRTHGKDL